MPSRRQIREAAIQFLYCADLEGGAPAANYRDTFWELLTESDRRSLMTSTFRALEHITQGRGDRLLELTERSINAMARLSASEETLPLKEELQLVLRYESAWSARYDSLRKIPLLDLDNDHVVGQLESSIKAIFAVDRELNAARQRFLNSLEDHPALRPMLEPVCASLRRLQRISDRLRMLESPQDFPEQSDLRHIRESHADLSTLRRDTDEMVDVVLHNKKEIDETLAAIIENFAPERINPVDRAILRLSASELLTRPDVSPKIIINEAVDLAKKFGSTDSGRFINGVLDQLARR